MYFFVLLNVYIFPRPLKNYHDLHFPFNENITRVSLEFSMIV